MATREAEDQAMERAQEGWRAWATVVVLCLRTALDGCAFSAATVCWQGGQPGAVLSVRSMGG